jgi:heat shock protein HtpX
MKRIFLLILTNLAVMVVLGIVLSVTGLDQYLYQRSGTNLGGLLLASAVIGFTGAFISLAMSKFMAKSMMGVQVIDQPRNATEQWLVNTVRAQAEQAGIGMPEVGIFNSPEPNAFATGARRDKALVAVSQGLLDRMSRTEAEAVLGHEITHVANGDMVTMTLLQGVLNTFVYFLSRVLGSIIDNALSGNRERRGGGGIGYFITVMVLQIVLGVLASMVLMWFSRKREFRADAGGARLSGRNNMIAALERLKAAHEPAAMPKQFAALGISGGGGRGFARLFMSHPPLDERIAALRASV